jgi:hypothetical protein
MDFTHVSRAFHCRSLANGEMLDNLTGAPAMDEPLVDLDIEDRKQLEFYLAEGQRLSHSGSWTFGRLGVPRSTLESKIRALKIDKGRFR